MIKWKVPTKFEPGFLYRKLKVIELLDEEPSKENIKKLVEFLAQFVEAESKEKAIEALLNASFVEYGTIITALLGYSNSVSDPKEESSVQP